LKHVESITLNTQIQNKWIAASSLKQAADKTSNKFGVKKLFQKLLENQICIMFVALQLSFLTRSCLRVPTWLLTNVTVCHGGNNKPLNCLWGGFVGRSCKHRE